jgi:hypothetical protein
MTALRFAFVGTVILVNMPCGWAGPVQLGLQGDARDFGFDGVTTEAELTAEPARQVEAPSLLPQLSHGTIELRVGHELTYRRRKGADFGEIKNGARSISILNSSGRTPDSTTGSTTKNARSTDSSSEPSATTVPETAVSRNLSLKKRIGWGLRLDQGYQNITVINGPDSGAFRGDITRLILGAGMQLNSKTSIGIGLDRNSIDAPIDIPALNFGGILNGLNRFETDYTENRLRLEINRHFSSATQIRLRGGYLFGGSNLRTSGFADQAHLPIDLSGSEYALDARRRFSGNREIAFSWFQSLIDGNDVATLNGSQVLGTTRAEFSQKRIGLFWRKHNPRRALSFGIEHNALSSSSSASIELGLLDPTNPVASLTTAALDTQLRGKTTMFKIGYVASGTKNFEYRTGMQIGRGRIAGFAAEEARTLFGSINRNEVTLRERARNILVPSLALTYKPGRNRLTFQIGQVIPLPQKRSGGSSTSPGPPGPPQPKSRSWGGTVGSISLQVPF